MKFFPPRFGKKGVRYNEGIYLTEKCLKNRET